MATYNIQWQSTRDGAPPEAVPIPGKSNIFLPQRTLNATSTDLTLTGRGINNYGEIQQENFIRLLENFASSNPPERPTVGQLWYNTQANTVNIYTNNEEWEIVGSLFIGNAPPANPTPGLLWWDDVNHFLFLCAGTTPPNSDYPKYHPDGTGPWVQLWPTPEIAAGYSEYNELATRINRIIGQPTTYGSDPDVAENQYGWGQTDLLPIYSDMNTCMYPGGSPISRPFDNNAWTILLSRLRKIALHTQAVNLSDIPTVGFIRDGRGYNSEMLGHSSTSQIPFTYGVGWNGGGMMKMLNNWITLNQALNTIEANRARMGTAPTSEFNQIVSTSRTVAWASTIEHTITVNFASADVAKMFFNSGGYLRFDASLTGGSGPLNASWSNFLANEVNGLIFDYKGIRRGSTYVNAPLLGTSLGFYDLTTTFQDIFAENREVGLHYIITDGGYKIKARYIGSLATLVFTIQFIEGNDGINVVNGTLASGITAFKPSNVNVNSPVIAYPTASSTPIQ